VFNESVEEFRKRFRFKTKVKKDLKSSFHEKE